MRVILNVWGSSPHWNGGCDYAIIGLAPELASVALRRIGRLREQQAGDRQLDESYFWDSHAAYFSPGWAVSGRLIPATSRPWRGRSRNSGSTSEKSSRRQRISKWRRTSSHVSSVSR